MRTIRFAALGLVLFGAACASGGGGGDGGGTDRYLITAEDLAVYPDDYNLYDAVSRLRRFWLQGSGGRHPRVFVDGQEMGGGPSLEDYWARSAAEVRFIRPDQAQTQYGPDYAGGVILVILR